MFFKNKKGQMFILDLLFAIVIAILLFFIIIKIGEVHSYNNNYDTYNIELNNIGHMALKNIYFSKDISCKIEDNENDLYVTGCINDDSKLNRSYLSIPINYKCSLTLEGTSISTNCNDVCNDEKFIIDMNVMYTGSQTLTKTDYLDYLNGTTTFEIKTLTLEICK